MIERIRTVFHLRERSLRGDGKLLFRDAHSSKAWYSPRQDRSSPFVRDGHPRNPQRAKLRVERSSVLLARGLPTLLMIACATPPPVDDEPPVQPIVVDRESSPPIYFEKVIYRIAAGTSYGGTYERHGGSKGKLRKEFVWDNKHIETEEYNIAANDLLSRTGYRAVDPTEALFTENSTIKTRFRIAGVVTKLHLASYLDWRSRERNFQDANVVMDIRLFDNAVKDIVYSKTFNGEGYDEGANPSALPQAVLNAVELALGDPEFVQMATRSAKLASSGNAPIQISLCDARGLSMPRDAKLVLEAVVTVRLGQAMGSGVMVSQAGHVVTAAHVVAPDSKPIVVLHSGLELEASVVRIDKTSDLALLRVPGSGHECAPLSLTDDVGVGTEIFAMGSPLGEKLSNSVTRGIVSGHREIEGQRLIQTDAAVNPGNSGGPLVDKEGRVLGIVTTKVFGIGVEGIGFGVPFDVVTERLTIDWKQD
jgi:serine protease Do